jgi:hypothetical protein
MAKQFDRFTVRADGLDGKKASEYEATILGMLRSYEATQMGRALLNGFRFYKREVLVYPYDGKLGHCNARAYSDWGMFRTKVSFSPQQWNGVSGCFGPGAAGNTPHEVFYHELIHGLRSAADTLGTFVQEGEEQIAITLANIFASEVNRPLRDLDRHKTTTVQTTSEDFLMANSQLFQALFKQHPDFCRWVAEVTVPFNPVRLYYLSLKGVPRLRTAPN